VHVELVPGDVRSSSWCMWN